MSDPNRSGRVNRRNRDFLATSLGMTSEEWTEFERSIMFLREREIRERLKRLERERIMREAQDEDAVWDSGIEEASIGKEEVKQIKKLSKRRPPRNAIEGLEVD